MTHSQLNELVLAARKATPGKWEQRGTTVRFLNGGFDLYHCPQATENAAYIALASPTAIISLYELLEEAREALKPFAEKSKLFEHKRYAGLQGVLQKLTFTPIQLRRAAALLEKMK